MKPVTPLSTATLTEVSVDPELSPKALANLSDAEVTDCLTTWAGRVAAGEARLLAYLGEFDERKAWGAWGILSCAHWLSWKLGMGEKAAGERVRIARALRHLPKTFAAFTRGQLSFTQVRAITRVATADDEDTFLGLARCATGQQLERLARGIRRARKASSSAKDDKRATPVTVRVRYEQDGDLIVSIRASAQDGAVLLAAIEAARNDLDAALAEAAPAKKGQPESPAEESRTRLAGEGEGVLHLCQAYLSGQAKAHPGRSRRRRARLTAQLDPISGWARLPDGELLPPGTIWLDVTGMAARPLEPSDLTRFDLGHTSREPSQALRDLLGVVDGERCRFPACSRRRRLHAHHVYPVSEGGRTDIANLVLLCSRHHHTVVHERGYRLVLDPTTRVLQVKSPGGKAIPHKPALPWRPARELDPTETIGSSTLPPAVRDKLDLHYAVSVLLQQAA